MKRGELVKFAIKEKNFKQNCKAYWWIGIPLQKVLRRVRDNMRQNRPISSSNERNTTKKNKCHCSQVEIGPGTEEKITEGALETRYFSHSDLSQ